MRRSRGCPRRWETPPLPLDDEPDHEAHIFAPFVRPSTGRIRYHPALPATSLARGYGFRPLRVLIRPWVMPDAIIRESKLWAPVRHARHPSVWCFLLAAIEPEMTRFQLRFDALYHYKRYSEEILNDDGSPETQIGLIRVENLTFCGFPVLELPITPAWTPSEGGVTLPV